MPGGVRPCFRTDRTNGYCDRPAGQADRLHAGERQPVLRPPGDDGATHGGAATSDDAARPDSHAFRDPIRRRPVTLRDPRRFGGVWWVGQADADAGMGPEPLTLRPAQLAGQLAATTRAIKAALLDQGLIAGLGNIFV